MRHLSRARARESLRAATAGGVPYMSKADSERWHRQQTRAAGW